LLEQISFYDVVLLSEIWISEKQLYNLNISGFDSYHIPENKRIGVNNGRYSGGLSLYSKSELKIEYRL